MYASPLGSHSERKGGNLLRMHEWRGEGKASVEEYHVVNKFPALAEAFRSPTRASCDRDVTFSRGVITLKDKSVAAGKKRVRLSRYAKPLNTGNNVKDNEMRAQIRTDANGKKYIIERHSLRDYRNSVHQKKYKSFNRELTQQRLLVRRSSANLLTGSPLNRRRKTELINKSLDSSYERRITAREEQVKTKLKLLQKRWMVSSSKPTRTDCFLDSGDAEFKERERTCTRLRSKVNLEAFNRKLRECHRRWKQSYEDLQARAQMTSRSVG